MVQELNLGLGLKSANVTAYLIKALDEPRHEKSDRATVGAVKGNTRKDTDHRGVLPE
ncbi:MAG TPA: hypothetical protein VMX97_13200 [Hyphomicrobiaceae bacterium]|nr:hypothetical protein [Hyphomicrobiaceae bacterium]